MSDVLAREKIALHTTLSLHAQQRLVKWNLNHSEIDVLVKHASAGHHAAAYIYQFGNDDFENLPEQVASIRDYKRLVGTTIVACKHCKVYIITVYRNPKAFKSDKKKRKYDIHKKAHYCPCCDGENVA